MPREKYSLMTAAMRKVGGYCTDPVGKCLREASVVGGIPQKDIDLCLRDSETYAAFQRGEKLSQRFNPGRAERGWLKWTENFSHRLPSSDLEVWIDRKAGVFREETSDRFGCLVDVESCLRYGAPDAATPRTTSRNSVLIPSSPEEDINKCESSYENEPETERAAIIAARRGQGRFRADLIQLWAGKCSVTKSCSVSLLRASHIKPWRVSTNAERLNRYNGLLLIPNLDAAFDVGLISFADDGKILWSQALSEDEAKLLGIKRDLKLVCVFDENRPFLAAHRQLHGFPN